MGLKNFGRKASESVAEGTKKVLNVDETKKNYSWIKTMIGALNPFAKHDGRIETWDNAVERLSVDERALASSYQNFYLRFAISGVVLVFGTLALLMNLDEGWIGLMPWTGFCAVCLSQMFVGSFRAYQIRRRQLCSAKEWIMNKSEWWPPMTLPPERSAPRGKK